MKTIIYIAIALLLLTSLSFGQVQWFSPHDNPPLGRPIFCYFYYPNGKRCQDVEQVLFKDQAIIRELANYHCVRLDSSKPENTHLNSKFRIYRVPTVLILDTSSNNYRELYRSVWNVTKDDVLKALQSHIPGKKPPQGQLSPSAGDYKPASDKPRPTIVKAPGSEYCDFLNASQEHFMLWGDFDNGALGRIDLGYGQTGRRMFTCDFTSGGGWGFGASIYPSINLNKDASANLSMFNSLKLKMSYPEGMQFALYFMESGSDSPERGYYPGVMGADGESYTTKMFKGTGTMQEYEIDMRKVSLRKDWGNQFGNKKFDLQGVRSIDVYIPGKSGSGQLTIEKIALY
jgi:hypothetical protein